MTLEIETSRSPQSMGFNLRHILQDVGTFVEEQAKERGLVFGFFIESQVPSLLHGDPGGVRKILLSLLEYALENCGTEGVSLVVTPREAVSEGPVEIEFGITVRGMVPSGGHQAELPLLCRDLCRQMGGALQLSPDGEEGASLLLSLPFGLSPVHESGSDYLSAVSDGRVEGRFFLLVSSRVENLQKMGAFMDAWSCRFDMAMDSEAAWEKLNHYEKTQDPVEAVLVDDDYGDLQILSLAERIRETAAFDTVKLVLVPEVGRPGEAEEARRAGYNAYLVKPLHEASLRAVLQHLFSPRFQGELVTRHTLREASLQDFRILIAEDDDINLLLVTKLVEQAGYPFEKAHNGREALEKLDNASFRLVLMDMRMPEMDGYEATRRIRGGLVGRENRDVPIIALTANTSPLDRQKGYGAGIDDYLAKPLDHHKLNQFLSYYAAQYQDMRLAGLMRKEFQKIHGRQYSREPRVWNREGLLRRVMDDDELLVQMVEAFLLEASRYYEVLQLSWEEKNVSKLKEASHAVKGLAATINLECLFATAKEVNDYLKGEQALPPEALWGRLIRDWQRSLGELIERGKKH